MAKKLDKGRVRHIVVHCSATPRGRDVSAADIDRYHRSLGWEGIGYHWVVRLDGSIEKGRDETLQGAHCKGLNDCSIGVCYVGGTEAGGTPADTRTPAQRAALERLLVELKARYPGATVIGHRDVARKACPSFDARSEYRRLGVLMCAAAVLLSSCSSQRRVTRQTVHSGVSAATARESLTEVGERAFVLALDDSMEVRWEEPWVVTADSAAVKAMGARSMVMGRRRRTHGRHEERDTMHTAVTVAAMTEKVEQTSARTRTKRTGGARWGLLLSALCVLAMMCTLKKTKK